jgi:hypothetical protein
MPGIPLSTLPGHDIAAALNSLPPCRADSPETAIGSVEIADLGLVLITFAKLRSRHHKTVRWFWTPESAELAAGAGGGVKPRP